MAHMSVDGLHDLPSRGSQTLQSGGRNQKWPTSGLCAYITPVLLGVPNPSKRWTKSEVAHKWAWWLHHPCLLGGPQSFKARETKSKVAHMSANCPHHCHMGSPTLQSRVKIRSSPHVGRLATSPLPCGVPNASKRGTKSEVAHKWAWWLHHPCLLGGPQRFSTGDKIRSGPQVGRFPTLPTSPLPYGVPNTSQRGCDSEVAHMWAW